MSETDGSKIKPSKINPDRTKNIKPKIYKNIVRDIGQMRTVTEPEIIEIRISTDGKALWINDKEKCIFKAYQIGKLFLNDDHPESKGWKLKQQIRKLESKLSEIEKIVNNDHWDWTDVGTKKQIRGILEK